MFFLNVFFEKTFFKEHFKKTFKIQLKDWDFYMDKFLKRKYVRS